MSQTLASTQQSNIALIAEIEAQRDEIDTLLNGLESVMRDLEGAGTVFADSEEMQGIEEEVSRNFAVGGSMKAVG